MKYVKMLGLAAVAAAALMAFVGAGTASAATLKSTGVALAAPVTIHAELNDGVKEPAILSTTDGSSIVDECEESTVQGKSTGSETPITGHIEKLIWGKCDVTTDTLAPGDLTITEAGAVSGAGSVVTVNIGVSCRYGTGTGTSLGTLTTGALNINAVINEQEPKQFLCPDTTRWKANYKITSPHDLTVG